MDTYDYQVLISQIRDMRSWQKTALAAVGAEKMAPVIQFLGLPETWRVVRESVNCAWEAASTTSPDVEKASRLLTRLNELPEWDQAEYNDSVPFWVGSAINFPVWAMQTITAVPSQQANSVDFSHILGFADEFDLAVSEYPAQIESSESIELAECKSQMWLVDFLQRHEEPSPSVIAALRREADNGARRIETVLPVYVFHLVAGLVGSDQDRRKRRGTVS